VTKRGENNNLNKLVQSDKFFFDNLGSNICTYIYENAIEAYRNLSNKNLCNNLNLNGNAKELSYCKNLTNMLLNIKIYNNAQQHQTQVEEVKPH
jgi:hypothetical protein